MASIPEQILAQVFAYSSMSGIATKVGRRNTEKTLAPNTVVAVPLGAPVIRIPNRPGDTKIDPTLGRMLLVREFSFEVWCHGLPVSGSDADYTVAESNYLAMLIACRQTLHNSVRFRDEQWIDQQEGEDSFERQGSTIKFFMDVDLTVYETRAGAMVTLPATAGISTTATEGTESVTFTQG